MEMTMSASKPHERLPVAATDGDSERHQPPTSASSERVPAGSPWRRRRPRSDAGSCSSSATRWAARPQLRVRALAGHGGRGQARSRHAHGRHVRPDRQQTRRSIRARCTRTSRVSSLRSSRTIPPSASPGSACASSAPPAASSTSRRWSRASTASRHAASSLPPDQRRWCRRSRDSTASPTSPTRRSSTTRSGCTASSSSAAARMRWSWRKRTVGSARASCCWRPTRRWQARIRSLRASCSRPYPPKASASTTERRSRASRAVSAACASMSASRARGTSSRAVICCLSRDASRRSAISVSRRRASATTSAGIKVSRGLKTSNRRVFAIGDVAGTAPYAQVADYHADIVIRRHSFTQPARVDARVIPRVTFTDPELAYVGLSEAEAKARVGKINVLRWPYRENDRAQAERQADGHVKVVTARRWHDPRRRHRRRPGGRADPDVVAGHLAEPQHQGDDGLDFALSDPLGGQQTRCSQLLCDRALEFLACVR